MSLHRKLSERFPNLFRYNLPESALRVLTQEEDHGAVVSNYFRYVFIVLLLYPVFASATDKQRLIINGTALGGYFLVTIAHTLLLKRRPGSLLRVFNYLSILMDYAIITNAIIVYYVIAGKDNMGFIIKNPINYFYFLPIVLAAFQFRVNIVVFSISCFLIIYYSFVAAAIYLNTPLTTDWYDYILGDKIVITDVLSKPLSYIAVALVIGYSIGRALDMIRRIGTGEEQKASLSRYFSPGVVERLLSGNLPSARQKVTVLFMDIRNFTKMSENMAPHVLSGLLSDFRESMLQVIFKNGGTLDKFIGDAIMATFGTPEVSPDPLADSRNAVSAALGMLEELENFNRQSGGERPEIRIGIGLHTGEVFAGNIGSGNTLEYTVIGDTVNTASRIESLCKKFDAAMIISAEVYAEAGDLVEAERLPRVKVKGKDIPLTVYKITGRAFGSTGLTG